MNVVGFTFVRNAVTYDYPVVESISSLLLLGDEVVGAVGKSEDDTLGSIQGIKSPKIRITLTVWDDALREDGRVRAVETVQKLQVKRLDATMYHYGWVKPLAAMQRKQETFNRLWHSDEWVAANVVPAAEFDYSQIDSLKQVTGQHPAAMRERIHRHFWHSAPDMSRNRSRFKDQLKQVIKKITGYRVGEYRNYKPV